jgi:tetratricopeptide (TPR) repeat protein
MNQVATTGIYFFLGILLAKLKRYDEAVAVYRKAIELELADAAIYFNLGNLLSGELKHYNEAEAAYRKASELDPEKSTSYNGFADF